MSFKQVICELLFEGKARLEKIEHSLASLHVKVDNMALDMTGIADAVAKETTVTQSAITLLQNLSEMIRQAGTNQTALDTLRDNLNAQADALAAAVVANTPAAATGETAPPA